MDLNRGKAPAYRSIIVFAVVATAIVLRNAIAEHTYWYWGLIVTLPLLLFAIWKR